MDKTINEFKKHFIELKLHITVKDIYRQSEYVLNKVKHEPKQFCPFHATNKMKCVCSKLENDIIELNYFNDHLSEIQNECPFKINTENKK